MYTFDTNFCNKIGQLSIKKFTDLPKTGKPSQDQWTVLAAIVKYNGLSKDYEVVALGTGSKCIGASKMSPEGDILNDSHGEIICRRSFLRYLYNQVNCALEDKESIFSKNKTKLELRDEYTFHFFITQMPCGDAAIFEKQNSDEFGDCLLNYPGEKNALKRSCEEDMQSPCKKLKNEEDIHRTGAKCLKDEPKQDLRLSGSEYHTLGAIRTKPGRGDPTLSVSCSDKLAKWTFLGIQGALLNLLIESPIYLSSVTIAGEVPYSKDAMLRALRDRFRVRDIEKPYCHKIPDIGQADVGFQYYKTDFKRPCPSSISWCNTPFKPAEFVIDGRKQGITKKHENKKISRLLISKKELFCTFIDIISKHNMFNLSDITNISYATMKSRAVLYSTVWNYIKNNIFKIWTVKNKELLNFSYD